MMQRLMQMQKSHKFIRRWVFASLAFMAMSGHALTDASSYADNKHPLGMDDVDQSINAINDDPALSDKQKQQRFWDLVITNKGNVKYKLYLDYLAFVKPTYLISDMIHEYDQQSDRKIKRMLLLDISESSRIQQGQKLTDEIEKQIAMAKRFDLDNLESETDSRLLQDFIFMAPQVMDIEPIKPLLEKDIQSILQDQDYLQRNPNVPDQ